MDTFQNTWRNIVCGTSVVVVCGVAVIYGFGLSSYNTVSIDTKKNTTTLFQPTQHQVQSAVSYTSYNIGGDVIFDTPVRLVPRKVEMFIPFDTRSSSASVMLIKDVTTGEVLFGKNEYVGQPIASITKLMTALILEELVVDWNISGTIPSDRVYDSHVMAGEEASLEEWYEVSLIGSSNRAILALVDATGVKREEFVSRMNDKAREIGMTQSVFVEPTGLDAGNISTGSDVAILLREALRYPRIVSALERTAMVRASSKTGNTHTVSTTNWLLSKWISHRFDFPVVGKTGYIVESGYNFAGMFTRDTDQSIFVVVLGAKDNTARFIEARDLAVWAFSNYYWK